MILINLIELGIWVKVLLDFSQFISFNSISFQTVGWYDVSYWQPKAISCKKVLIRIFLWELRFNLDVNFKFVMRE